MNINFVKTPFTNKPTMSRHHGQIFNKTPNQTYILEKQKQLEFKTTNLFKNNYAQAQVLYTKKHVTLQILL